MIGNFRLFYLVKNCLIDIFISNTILAMLNLLYRIQAATSNVQPANRKVSFS